MEGKKINLFNNEMYEMEETVLTEIVPETDCTVENLVCLLAEDEAYKGYRQALYLLGTCGEAVSLNYGAAGAVDKMYKDRLVKTVLAVVQPGTRHICYSVVMVDGAEA